MEVGCGHWQCKAEWDDAPHSEGDLETIPSGWLQEL